MYLLSAPYVVGERFDPARAVVRYPGGCRSIYPQGARAPHVGLGIVRYGQVVIGDPQLGGAEHGSGRYPDRGAGDLCRPFQVDLAVTADFRLERIPAERAAERAAAADGQFRLPAVHRHRAGEFGVAVDAQRQCIREQRTADTGAAADLERQDGSFDVVRELGVAPDRNLAVVAAVDGRLCRPVARNPQLAVVAAYRAREFAES